MDIAPDAHLSSIILSALAASAMGRRQIQHAVRRLAEEGQIEALELILLHQKQDPSSWRSVEIMGFAVLPIVTSVSEGLKPRAASLAREWLKLHTAEDMQALVPYLDQYGDSGIVKPMTLLNSLDVIQDGALSNLVVGLVTQSKDESTAHAIVESCADLAYYEPYHLALAQLPRCQDGAYISRLADRLLSVAVPANEKATAVRNLFAGLALAAENIEEASRTSAKKLLASAIVTLTTRIEASPDEWKSVVSAWNCNRAFATILSSKLSMTDDAISLVQCASAAGVDVDTLQVDFLGTEVPSTITMLQMAAHCGNIRLVCALLEDGANPLHEVTFCGESANAFTFAKQGSSVAQALHAWTARQAIKATVSAQASRGRPTF